MNHDCIANSVVEKSETIGTNTVRRSRTCKICSKTYSTVETYKGMAISSNKEVNAKVDTIIDNVCEVFDVKKKALMGKERPKRLALVRHVAMYLCRDAGYSFPQIGKIFGRHHATIIYACRHIEKEIFKDPELRKFVLLARFHAQTAEE